MVAPRSSIGGVDRAAFLVLATLAASACGCRPVTETTRVYDDLARWREITHAEPKDLSTATVIATALDEGTVRLDVVRQPMGTLVRSRSGPRKVVVERETGQRAWGWAGLCLGLAAEALGVWAVADAHNVPTASDPNRSNRFSRTAAYSVGGVLIGVGLPMLIPGINELVRSRDTVVSDSDATEETSRTDVKIGDPVPWADQAFQVVVGKAIVTSIRTDGRGVAKLDASQIPLDVLVANGGAAATAMIRAGDVPVSELKLDWAMRWHEKVSWAALQPAFELAAMEAFVTRFPASVHVDEVRARIECTKVARSMGSVNAGGAGNPIESALDGALGGVREVLGIQEPAWAINSPAWGTLRLSCQKYWSEAELEAVDRGAAILMKHETAAVTAWKRRIITDAREHLGREEYGDALDLLASAISVHPEDKQLAAAKRQVEATQARSEAREAARVERENRMAEAREAAERTSGRRSYLIQAHWGLVGNVISRRDISVKGSSDRERDVLACRQFCNQAEDQFTCVVNCRVACAYGSKKLPNGEIFTCGHD